MPAFLLELFSEEIPAGMQVKAAADLDRLLCEALSALVPTNITVFSGPRRIAFSATVEPSIAAASSIERGPRTTAPEQALAGFLRKHSATRESLREEGGFWILNKSRASVSASDAIAAAVPALLRRFPWPKAMRWGGTSQFTWIRPLRRIICLLDHAVVPFDLSTGSDDGHGLTSGRETEGHRFHTAAPITLQQAHDWEQALLSHNVVASADTRRDIIVQGSATLAQSHGLEIVEDAGLFDEVSGLVEWPVPLLGRIDDEFMDLPAEVMQVSMRVNQRYFATTRAGRPAPHFVFVANIDASDGGAAIIAGNERVLRARFADARHFWNVDRKTPLQDRIPVLAGVTFHAELGTQLQRVQRLEALAAHISSLLGADDALCRRAALLAKADLATGLVGEFPELQGVMGSYYAIHDGENSEVAEAIRRHYAPRGASDAVPSTQTAIVVSLADKIDQLTSFFAVGQRPTGSGDPFALRRAALGVTRTILENNLRLPLRDVVARAADLTHATLDASSREVSETLDRAKLVDDVFAFIAERLRIQLRTDGARHDVLLSVYAVADGDDLALLVQRADSITRFIATEAGRDLLAAAKRAANILRIEERTDGPFGEQPNREQMMESAEFALADALGDATQRLAGALSHNRFDEAMTALATLRAPVDEFFDTVTINDPNPVLRRNRLVLLAALRRTMDRVAEFSRIES